METLQKTSHNNTNNRNNNSLITNVKNTTNKRINTKNFHTKLPDMDRNNSTRTTNKHKKDLNTQKQFRDIKI